jgi:hypothetical protein
VQALLLDYGRLSDPIANKIMLGTYAQSPKIMILKIWFFLDMLEPPAMPGGFPPGRIESTILKLLSLNYYKQCVCNDHGQFIYNLIPLREIKVPAHGRHANLIPCESR